MSFRELSGEEAGRINPVMVRIHTVKNEKTLEGVLRALGRPQHEIRTVALLNAWDPESLPGLAPGQVIKVLMNK